jgi:hypothetical protein
VSKLREWCDGLGGYLGIAGVLLGFALLCFLLLIQSSSDRLLWLGDRVVGKQSQGTISYTWHGESHLIAVPGAPDKPRVAVYLDPSNPDNAITNSVTTRILDAGLTVLPASVGVVIVLLGVLRRRRLRQLPLEAAATYGTGLDPEFVQRQLDQLRRPPT